MARRRPGTGAIFKSRGRYVAQVGLPGTPRRFVTRWCRSRDDARIALAILLDQYAVAPTPDARLPLAEYVEGWFRTSGAHLAPESKRAYRIRITPIVDALGKSPIGRLRVSDIERVMAAQATSGASPRAIASAVTVLGIILNSAYRDGAILRNVAHDARKPRFETPEVRVMSLVEARAILDATEAMDVGPIVALLIGSGLRIGEALALDWSDIDFDAGTVRVRSGKTPRSRRIAPVTASALETLRARRQLGGLVFDISANRVRVRFNAAMAAAKLPKRHLHELRHGHATLLLATGTDMRVIADQLGHAKPSMTSDIYAHVQQGAQRLAVDRLGDALTER
ncbi:MAG: tyrosine-type recombinase/integrase [Candidatus Limnocylindrales bacterium]